MDLLYVKVAVVLAVLTGIEVIDASYVDFGPRSCPCCWA